VIGGVNEGGKEGRYRRRKDKRKIIERDRRKKDEKKKMFENKREREM
jgi:hypothetical protein